MVCNKRPYYICTVKKLCAIFLLASYLFSATDIKEIFKINVVINHLHEHQKKDQSILLIDFLVMHYVTDDGNNMDDNTDKSLPFKSADSHLASLNFVSVPLSFSLCEFQFFDDAKSCFLNAREFFILPNFYASIWHPPQLS